MFPFNKSSLVPEYALALKAQLYSVKPPFVSFAAGVGTKAGKRKYNHKDVSCAYNEMDDNCICLVTYTLNFSGAKSRS